MLKTHHKMKCWNRQFQYLSAKIICKIVKYQYLPAKTIHFSLSHLTLSSLSHIPLSSLLSWLWFHSQSLSVTLEQPLFEFILMHLFRGLSSELIIPACVRASPSLGEAQNICFCTTLSEISENHICILQYLATVAFKTPHEIDTFFAKCSKHTHTHTSVSTTWCQPWSRLGNPSGEAVRL